METKNKISKYNGGKLKFIQFPEMEYLDLQKGSELLLRLNKGQCEQISSVTRAEAQILLYTFLYNKHGAKYPPGLYNYQFREPSGSRIEKGKLRLIADESLNIKSEVTMADKNIENELTLLKKTISDLSKKSESSIDGILAATKIGHEAEVRFLKMQLDDKDKKITELKNDYAELEREFDKAEKALSEANTTDMLSQITNGLTGLLKNKVSPVQASTLSGIENNSDVPLELTQIINSVDWVKVTSDDIQSSVSAFNQFANFKRLPRKQ